MGLTLALLAGAAPGPPARAAAGRAAPVAEDPEGDALRVGRHVVSMREILDFADELSTDLQSPRVYELAIARVTELAGASHPLAGYLRIRQARAEYGMVQNGSPLGAVLDRREPGRRPWPRNNDLAFAHAVQGETVLQDHLANNMRFLSENDARRMAHYRESALDLILTLAVRAPDDGVREQAWEVFLRSRCIVLDEMAARRRRVFDAGDSVAETLSRELTLEREWLSGALFAAPDSTGRTRQAIGASQSRLDSLEAALAARCVAFAADRQWRRAGLRDVLAALRPGEALVSYAYYLELPFPSPPRRDAYRFLDRAPDPPSVHIMAFVFRPGMRGPEAIQLGEAAAVDSLIDAWRLAATGGGTDSSTAGPLERRARAVGARLRSLVWDPLLRHLPGVEQLFLVPDGALLRVSFDALPAATPQDAYLAETAPALHYLNAERDLARRPAARTSCGILAMGGMTFTDSPAVDPDPLMREAIAASGCELPPRIVLPDLPRSAGEAASAVYDLAARFAGPQGACVARLVVGNAATKRRFIDESTGRAVLHLSTHAFAFECRVPARNRTDGDAGYATRTALSPVALRPLLLSGLVFSPPAPGARDAGGACLTAEEIGGLNLPGTRLVVLSACSSGLGMASRGEGLLGMTRAFTVAGAEELVVSIWPVGDAMANAFMHEMYASLGTNLDAAPAIRAAELRLLARLRARGIAALPDRWSGFLAVGVAPRAVW